MAIHPFRLALLLVGVASAAAPALALAAEPTLKETLALIVREVGGQRPVNYVATAHDPTTGQDGVMQVDTLADHVSANAAACKVVYHWKIIGSGQVVGDQSRAIALGAVTDVQLHPAAQGASPGQPPITTTPPVYVVLVKQGAAGNALYFRDPDVAGRVADAFTRAAKLCGGDKAPAG